VDDDEGAPKQLLLLLQESFPGSEIIAAQSVNEALVHITEAIEHDAPYRPSDPGFQATSGGRR
jgi:hypothetical protein